MQKYVNTSSIEEGLNEQRYRFRCRSPVLASLDIQRSVNFFVSKLGFDAHYMSQGHMAS